MPVSPLHPRYRSHLSVNWQSPVDWRHPLNRGLVGWWLVVPHWSGGTVLRDLMGRHHGSLTNMAPASDWLTSGRSGGWGALDFDGTDDRVEINSVFGLGTTDLSATMWVYLDSTSEQGAFLKIGDDTDASNVDGFAIGVGSTTMQNSGNNLILLYEYVRFIATGDPIGTGWHHVAMVIDPSGYPRWFIDGRFKGSQGTAGGRQPTETTKIGGYSNEAGGSRHTDCGMDCVRIFNRALSDYEVWADYTATSRRETQPLNRIAPVRFLPEQPPATAGAALLMAMIGQ